MLSIAVSHDEELDLFRERLEEIDLTPIKFKLMDPEEGKGWDVDKADQVMAGYKVFLLLSKIFPDKSIVPTTDIDAFWHYHILDTQLYQEHCMYLFGMTLHHFPYFGMRSAEDRANLESAFEETKQLFEQYGALVPDYYAHCGSSCGASLCDNTACDNSDCKPKYGESTLMPQGEQADAIRLRIAELMTVRPSIQSL